jgi:hypothetical protein
VPDDYERVHMKGQGAMIHRHKARLPLWVFGVAAGIPGLALGGGGGALLATGALPFAPSLAIAGAGVGVALLVAAILLASGVVRVAVSEGELDAQIGTHHLRIPIDEIASVEVAPSPTKNVGVGVRRTLGGEVVYSMLGSPKRAVHLRRRGREKATVLVCREPDALAEAIEEARQRRHPQLRIDPAASEPDAEDEAVEVAESDSGREAEATE